MILKNSDVADALETCDWSNVSIGNKAIIADAIYRLRAQADSQAPVNESVLEFAMYHPTEGRILFYGFLQPTIAPSVAHRGGDAWISVKDRLPELEQAVLVAWDHSGWIDERCHARMMDSDGWLWYDCTSSMLDEWDEDELPTHWMPLPAAPESTEDVPAGHLKS